MYYPNVSITNMVKVYIKPGSPSKYEMCIKTGDVFKRVVEEKRCFISTYLKKVSVWYNKNHGKKKTGGYAYVDLYQDGKRYHFRLATLVARHCIPNPDPKIFTEVDHKDHDRKNYQPRNLRWADKKGNTENRRKKHK